MSCRDHNLLPELPKGASYRQTGVLTNPQGLLSDYSISGRELSFSAYQETAGAVADLILTVQDAATYQPYDLTVRLLTVPVSAALKGSVKGHASEEIPQNQEVVVTLSGATFKTPFSAGQPRVTNLTEGLTAAVLPGETASEAVTEFSGVPLTTFNEPAAITIPHDALENARSDMPVTNDENVILIEVKTAVKSPQTGDHFPLTFYLLLLMLSAVGIAVVKAKKNGTKAHAGKRPHVKR